MRQSAAGSKTLPVTPRALETIIRLSSAHAKSRLSRVVEEIDCRVALEIMTFALNNNVCPKIEKLKFSKMCHYTRL